MLYIVWNVADLSYVNDSGIAAFLIGLNSVEWSQQFWSHDSLSVYSDILYGTISLQLPTEYTNQWKQHRKVIKFNILCSYLNYSDNYCLKLLEII